ncbi:HET-s/LopB domain-containing protein [Ophiocordyceps sinensis CO18]|uniref:HET-s/LopB domain-containing protein n=1 Tax=Ophiocordyceps sinensis (strain Co18 / CGMCC 3.14243) TaxID=911162 RepID=T5AA12_OPHSC|nr:HET-s/LopB domain-containing protein [Ophiocordyceps sinensis CO18]
MDSYLPGAGFQLPFQRRLSRLYNDTKKSTDFLQEPVRSEEDPDVRALHRKLRIQKDRLVSWGLEWSDSSQSPEIDDSISEAGLSEVVASIMSTIKDTLAEAELLWLSSKRLVDSPRPSPDRKPPLVHWDKARFEDLVHDLTVSIDTLYDISRTRSSAAMRRRSPKSSRRATPFAEETRLFESSRVQTPRLINPRHLLKSSPLGSPQRQVVFLKKPPLVDLVPSTSTVPDAPLLLEYAPYDPMYVATGIMPEMVRFEKLSAALQQEPQRATGTWTGLPRLLGYFEDLLNSRIGLVYRFPFSFGAVVPTPFPEGPTLTLESLNDLLSRPEAEPPLEAKFKLAFNLANTVFDMHARGFAHGNLNDKNISFRVEAPAGDGKAHQSTDIRCPLVSSFDLFGEGNPSTDYYSHNNPPHRCRLTDERVLDLSSLGKVLLSIGLWTKFEILAPRLPDPPNVDTLFDRLAVRCGSLYVGAVWKCWDALHQEATSHVEPEALVYTIQACASRNLEACCFLDGMSRFERLIRPNQDMRQEASEPLKDEKASSSPPSFLKDEKASSSPSSFSGDRKISPASDEPVIPKPLEKPVSTDVKGHGTSRPPRISRNTSLMLRTDDLVNAVTKSETKIRLYPHVLIAPEVVEEWNSILMPKINQALQHFYRKHPESVEMSLESVGPSPAKAQPTVLVVCTSVGKVRAILKKRLAELFDGTATGFGLKVCKGHVLRSRGQPKPGKAPSARQKPPGLGLCHGLGSDDADNPEYYQERPNNGASIGAWIGDRHLPPVSFGGLVLVDDKPYGMTVHHMLDDPDQDFGHEDTTRSSATADVSWYSELDEKTRGDDDDDAYDLSDTESETYSESDLASDYDDEEDEEDEEDEFEPGDVPGVEPGCGEGYVVTQPALDDVNEGFFPCAETEDEDHLNTFGLGEVFASSGIRRKQANGLVHEVDWALFRFSDGRLPDDNYIPRAADASPCRARPDRHADVPLLRPTCVAPSSSLPGMEVQCVGRTSGVQTGYIMPALTSVKIYGRKSPSHTYQVTSSQSASGEDSGKSLGLPGDSGAWVVDRLHGQLCGHVLAWSQRKRVAYICPMEILLLDVAETLEANEIRLPGGEPVVTFGDAHDASRVAEIEDRVDEHDISEHLREEEDNGNEGGFSLSAVGVPSTQQSPGHGSPGVGVGTSSPIRLETSSELRGLANKLEELSAGPCRRISVS